MPQPTDPTLLATLAALKAARLEKRLTIRAVANLVRVSESTISGCEAVKGPPKPANLKAWGKALGVPIPKEAMEAAIASYRRFAKAECGTSGGYARHTREKTPICDPCRQAELTRQKHYRDQAKLRQKQNG